MNHGTGIPPAPRYDREAGIFVCADADGEELRLHRDGQTGKFEVVRWRQHPDAVDGWVGPMVFYFSATEIHDMSHALRRVSETAGKGATKR